MTWYEYEFNKFNLILWKYLIFVHPLISKHVDMKERWEGMVKIWIEYLGECCQNGSEP